MGRPSHACLLLGVLALAAGCSEGKKTSVAPKTTTAGSTSAATSTTAPTTTAPALSGSRAYETWFTHDGRLDLVWREGDETVGVLTQALLLVLAGPGPGDGGTAIPAGTELVNVDLAEGVATIDLTRQFLTGPEGKRRLAIGQLAYTATQFPTVRAVRILVAGEGASDLARRRNFTGLLAPIVVERPTGLEPAASPIVVTGSANVFEANVTVRLLDASGKELVSTFTTATCGTGCRGRFRTSISYEVESDQPGTLVLADDDADGNGSPQYEVRLPVELVAG